MGDKSDLEGSKNLGASGGAFEASIKEGSERTGPIVGLLNIVVLTIWLLLTLVDVGQPKFSQHLHQIRVLMSALYRRISG